MFVSSHESSEFQMSYFPALFNWAQSSWLPGYSGGCADIIGTLDASTGAAGWFGIS